MGRGTRGYPAQLRSNWASIEPGYSAGSKNLPSTELRSGGASSFMMKVVTTVLLLLYLMVNGGEPLPDLKLYSDHGFKV
jgi:hypothetical protein